MTQELQSGLMAFRPRARLLKLIGAELISDDVLAITELVKNAHDADATEVSIEFKGVTGPRGELIIRDNGFGMDLETVLGRWMEPAGSSKTRQDQRRTPQGRRMLGEKGVGRFAADKLGRHLDLLSRRAGAPTEVVASFDWDQFESDSTFLSDVQSGWQVRPAIEIESQGTILRMHGLRSVWNERMFRRLCTRLTRLRSPFQDQHNLSIRIDSDEFPHYSGELRADFLDRAPYRIDVSFDGSDTITVALNGQRPVSHRWNGAGEIHCGPLRVRLFAFDLETEALARIGPRLEARAWLREWSGVSVYRDGFRVWPYGEPHDDWLRLDQRRVNNPVVRLSNNQVVGFVEITRDGNPNLVDQTNREGLIHNRALEDLRRLMSFIFQLLEAERQALRHPTQRSSPGTSPRVVTVEDSVPASLESLAEKASPAMATELRRIAAKVVENASRAEAQRRRMLDGYADLAAAGHTAAGVSQAVAPLVKQLREQCKDLRSASTSKQAGEAREGLRQLEQVAISISERLALLMPADDVIQRRRAIDVASEVESFRELMQPVLDDRGVQMHLEYPRNGVLRVDMRPESFHRLLHILTANSLDWLRRARNAEIRIVATPKDDVCEIVFSDTGPGIPAENVERIFNPLFSTKEGGRGMGLTLARDLLGLHSGGIEVITDRRRRGANLRIILPRKRSRATVHRE